MKILRIFSQVFNHLQSPKESWTFPEICGCKVFFLPLRSLTEIMALGVFLLIEEIVFEWNIEGSRNSWGWKDIALLNPLHKAGSAGGVPRVSVGIEYLQGWKLHVQPLSPHSSQSFVLSEQWPRTQCCVSKSLCLNRQLFTSGWRLSSGLWDVSVQDNLQDWDPSLYFLLYLALCLVCHVQWVNCVRLSHNYEYCDYNKAVV